MVRSAFLPCLRSALPQSSARRQLSAGKYHRPFYETRRHLLSVVSEVPLDSLQPERPISCILAEDQGLYDNHTMILPSSCSSSSSSWESTFTRTFPKEYGMQCCSFQIDQSLTSFDSALQELETDASNFVDAVFIARGPWMSWMAQFHLESLPFKGLVMVDPIPLDDSFGVQQFQALYKQCGLESSQQYQMFLEYAEHYDHWTLQLEPGSVPMMILRTTSMLPSNQTDLKQCAAKTAKRHTPKNAASDDDSGDHFNGHIPIHELSTSSTDSSSQHGRDAVDTIAAWICQRVL
ncbi:hypothetical protein ACA910_000934 [Epithemia clementina (nom. ined.)]